MFFAEQTFEIERVANIHRPSILQLAEEWTTISSTALRSCNALLLNDERPGIGNNFHSRNDILAPIHCKCAVVLHSLQPRLKGPLPLPYIGVSKLSCFACWEFLACLREWTGVYFITRGIHGKTYFPWKYLYVELRNSKCRHVAPQIYQSFFARMTERYTTCIKNARQKVMIPKEKNQLLGCKRKFQALLNEEEAERTGGTRRPGSISESLL